MASRRNTRKDNAKQDGASANASGSTERAQSPTRQLFFYMANAAHGELCQWYPSKFTVSKEEIKSIIGREIEDADGVEDAALPAAAEPETITFGCAEQVMMYCKAARFGDRETQALVMATDSPKEQKALGRGTAGFIDESWDEVKSEVVVAGNMAKFGQDAYLGRKLLATGDRTLAEAASRDRVWGIGYNAKTAPRQRKHWGENRLGKALMVVRDRLRAQDEIDRATRAC